MKMLHMTIPVKYNNLYSAKVECYVVTAIHRRKYLTYGSTLANIYYLVILVTIVLDETVYILRFLKCQLHFDTRIMSFCRPKPQISEHILEGSATSFL